jgi:thymidylate synthase (FAD)
MTVELINSMGGDLSIVNAARVSLSKRSNTMNEADIGLLKYLMKNRHGSPFEMVQFQFRVRCSIGVAREWFRHRIGSFNETSTRYIEMRPDFYMPLLGNVRRQIGKSGYYIFEPLDNEPAWDAIVEMRYAYNFAYESYQNLLKLGVARELARNVLPLGLLTEFVWSVNARSLLNFLSLRTAPNALLEIRLEAEDVERLVTPIIPHTMAAWNENGRIAP